MSILSNKLRSIDGGRLGYWCQGCEEMHVIDAKGWNWDGNAEKPTFSPSVLVRGGHYAPGHKAGEPCWCTYNAEHPDKPAKFRCHRCHTFIKAGMVQFLGDCTHEFAGKTVPLPDLPDTIKLVDNAEQGGE